MVTVEEAAMATLETEPMIDVMVTVNLWFLGNIFTLLMKIQLLGYLVQPGSSAKIVSAMLWATLGFMITPTLPLKIILMIQNNNLLSPNMMSVPLWKETFHHIQLLPEIAKGTKKVMKNRDYFQREDV